MEQNDNQNNNVTGEGNQTGDMYRYNGQDSTSNEIPKESNAIRRSLSQGENPYILNPTNNNIKDEQDQNSQQNAIGRNIGDRIPNNADFPNYGERSSEQRFPPNLQETHNPFQMNGFNNKQLQPTINPPLKKEPKNNYAIIYILICIIQIISIVLIGILYEFKKDGFNDFSYLYHFFKDVHLMIFIGFGLLYTALKDHQWSSIAIVLFIGIISFEISFFWNWLWHHTFYQEWGKLKLDFDHLIQIDYFSATALISLGALIGKLSILQIFIISIFETFSSSFNFYLCNKAINAFDNGGSLYIHTFGAIFGIVIAIVNFCNKKEELKILNNPHLNSDYYSNIISFIGSLFLWLYFPSFNTAKIQIQFNKDNMEIFRYRGIVNTYLSMVGSVIGSFIISPIVSKGKLKIEHLLNASYVGGIIIGGCCTVCHSAWGGILIGFIGGCLSVLGLWKLKKKLKEHKLDDTFGIMYTFGIPGILGGFLNSIFMGFYNNKSSRPNINGVSNFQIQAGKQIAAIFITIGISFAAGIISGFCIKMPFGKNEIYFVDSELFYEDENIPFPEWKYRLNYNNINLDSSGNKLDNQGKEKEVKINN